MLPNLDSIACFVAAAKTLNFRAGAKAVALTPAAFGKRIAQLEDLLGTQLFERTTRRISLTPAGTAMLPKALRLLEAAQACIDAGRVQSGPSPVTITVGTRHELGISWVLPMIDALAKVLPHLTVDLYFGSGPDLEERVKAFDIDCAVTSRVFVDPVFDVLRLTREEYAFVGAASMLTQSPLLSMEDAQKHTLVDVQPEKPLFRYFRDAVDSPEPLRFLRTRIMGTTAAVRHCIIKGNGVGVLPLYLIAPDLAAGRLQRIFPSIQLNSDYFRLMYRQDDPRANLYNQLAAFMRTHPLT
jgi:LysR family glycine cleavage system transcriptional activator